jgi:arsenical pump membrane protein
LSATIFSTLIPVAFRPLVTIAIFLATLVLMLKRPWKLPEAWATAIGSALMLMLGLETIPQAWETISQGKEVLLFLLALMLFSALLDQSGFFEWAAIHAARAANGSCRKLFRNVFLIGALITAFLSLDTTAIILTPIVLSFIHRLKLQAKPFVIACAFVSNTGSLLLPVSNLSNLLFQNAFQISFSSFALHMVAVQIIAVALNYWIFVGLFANSMPKTYEQNLPVASSIIKDAAYFRGALVALTLVLVGYFFGPQAHIQPYIVATCGCGMLAILGLWRRQLDLAKVSRDVSWSLFPFVIGLFVVMRGVENLGLAKTLASWLALIGDNSFWQIIANAFAAGIGSNLINNIPMSLLSISVLKQLHLAGNTSQFGALLGCNLGPNLTIVGSLATMLVINAARKRGEDVGAWDFFKAGIIVTPVLLLACSICLWLTCRLLGTK